MAKRFSARHRVLSLALGLSLFGSQTLQAAPAQEPSNLQDRTLEKQAARASNQFGWTLLQDLRKQKFLLQKNILFSPLSAWLALTMASNGAEAETLGEMRKVLALSPGSLTDWNRRAQALSQSLLAGQTEETLRLANSIWVNSEGFVLDPRFKATTDSFFSALPNESISRSAPFSQVETLEAMNAWVNENTAGMIPTILEELEPDMMAILLNALYFQGQWQEQFARGLTQAEPFVRADGSRVKVPTLRMLNTSQSYRDDGSFKMLSLNFRAAEDSPERGRFQLDLVVPSQRTGSIAQFGQTQYEKLLSERRLSLVNLVKIPRFKFDFSQSLGASLQAQGMKRAFSSSAQLGALGRTLSGNPTNISEVLQKTAVEMDENGFKAAAVTAVTIKVTAAIEPDESSYIEFVADRPFFFALRDTQTGTLLFQGVLQDPK